METVRSESRRGIQARIAASAFALLAVAPLALAQTAPAQAPPASNATLDRIRETGRIRLGYRADARPISFKDESGSAAGYAVDLCTRVVEGVKGELGLAQLAVDWVPVTLENRFSAVAQGEVDLVCGPDTATLARRKEVSFSIPIFPGGIGALLRADASSQLKDLLSGRKPDFQPTWRANAGRLLTAQKFEVVKGTTSELWLAGKSAEFDLTFEVSTVESYEAGLQRLRDRKADVFFGDRVLLLEAAGRSPASKDVVVLDRLFTVEPLALVLARGDDDFRLAVDRALSWLYNNGKTAELYSKWCGKPPGNVTNFFRMTAIPE